LTGLHTGAVVAGDVRVTTSVGHAFDGVQKVHLVSQSAAVGFAGSVRLGLRAVADLQRFGHELERTRSVTDFRAIIDQWARRARHAWERDVAAASREKLHLLVVTTWLVEGSTDIEAVLGVPFAQSTAFVLKSPRFNVERLPADRRSVAIGSGQAHARLSAELGSIEEEVDGLLTFEIQPAFVQAGGAASPIRAVLSNVIRDVEPADVSEYLHVAMVKPNASTVVTFDMGGLRMPDVASTEEEWNRLAARHGVADATAAHERPVHTSMLPLGEKRPD